MIRTFTYKLYRNERIERRFERWVSTCRYVYNVAKEVRETAFAAGVKVSHYELCKQLTQAKKDIEFLRQVNAQTLQGALDQLEAGYQSYFRKRKSGEVARMKDQYLARKDKHGGKVNPHVLRGMGKPNWAKKDRFASFVFKQGTDQTAKGFRLSKFGTVKVHNNRPVPGKIKTARMMKRADGLYLSVVAEVPDRITTASKNQAVGIDMGIAHFLTTSEGQHVPNPRFLQRQLPALRRAQRSLARKVKGSRRWREQKQVVARLYQRVTEARKDFLHKTSTALCAQYGTVVREDLNVSGMVRGKLSRHISDVSWASFFAMLEYKAGEVVKVNAAYTSQGCSHCGAVDADSRLTQSVYCCTSCGHQENADVNASKNILGRSFPVARKARPLGQGLGEESHAL